MPELRMVADTSWRGKVHSVQVWSSVVTVNILCKHIVAGLNHSRGTSTCSTSNYINLDR